MKGALSFAPPPAPAPAPAKEQAKPRETKPKAKNDPKLVSAVRELRDRWLERVNEDPAALLGAGKYDVARQLSRTTAARSRTTGAGAAAGAADGAAREAFARRVIGPSPQ